MDHLPGTLRKIAAVTDEATALTLARELGGTPLKLSADPNGKLARLVGPEKARAIVEQVNDWGPGETIIIPMANVRGARARRANIARLLASGATVNKAALAGDVHSRTVKRIKASMKENSDDSLPLFRKL